MTDPISILAELRERAGHLDLPRGSPVRSVAVRKRERSTLYVYSVGEGPNRQRLIVKVPHLGRADVERGRPRQLRPIDVAEKPARELAALRLVEQEITRAGDPRFRAVRALGLILEGRALVMLEDRGVPLSRMLLRYGRWSRGETASVERAFGNAGAWLRRYHELPTGEAAPDAVATRDGFLSHTQQLVDHLSRHRGARGALAGLAPLLRDRAKEVLTPALPIGLHHGDFAMRNVLVGEDVSVAVIDMLATLRAPIYKDLATMLVALHANRAQTYSLGLAFDPRRLARLELALFEGYEASRDTAESARLFAVTQLLDKWAAQLESPDRTRVSGALAGWLIDRHYARLAQMILPAAPSPGGAAPEPGL